jgi:hypothetical protein
LMKDEMKAIIKWFNLHYVTKDWGVTCEY